MYNTHTKLPFDSTVPLSSPEGFSVFQLIVLVFYITVFFKALISLFTAFVMNLLYLPSTKHQTDKVSEYVVNKVENLQMYATGVGGDQNRAKTRLDAGLTEAKL